MNGQIVMFDVELSSESESMIDRLRQFAPYKIPLALKRAMDSAIPEAIDDIRSNRLSGKGPFPPDEHRLGEVTGLLKSSVEPIPSTMDVSDDSCTIGGGIQVIGVIYAPVHEFGYTGTQSVSSHSRSRTKVRTTSRSGRILKRPVKTITQHAVRSFTRHMDIPARAPFRTGMQENLFRISDATLSELRKAVENV